MPTALSISTQISGLPTIPGMQNNGTIIGGQYTLTGSGGKDVGPFTGLVNLGSPLTITGGLPSTVNRSAGLTAELDRRQFVGPGDYRRPRGNHQ